MTDHAATLPQSQPLPAAEFIDLARRGKNNWWRYLLGIVGLLLFLFVAAIFINIWLPEVAGMAARTIDPSAKPAGETPFLSYLELNLNFIALLFALAFVVVVLHRRPFRTLITASPQINWKRIGIGFGLWFVLAAVLSLIEHLLYPGRYEFGPNVRTMLLPSLAVLVLTPIQAATEELLFRGYIMQGLALRIRNPFILAAVTGFIFMLVHLANPEISAGFVLVALYYWAFGVLLALVAIRSQGLELSIGIHAANNLFTALIANQAVTALTTDSIFVIKVLDPVFGLISFVLAATLVYLLVARLVAQRPAPAVSV
jgi:hypothetical protein